MSQSISQSAAVQARVLHALFLRELKTRFGTYRLGYLWALLSPLAQMAVMLLILGYFMHRVMPGISFPVFLTCGLVPYAMFSSIATRSLSAIEANRGLLSYRPVHPLDTLITRAWLELMVEGTVFALFMGAFVLLGEDISLADLPMLLAIWGLLTIFALGLGMMFMVVGHAIKESEKLMPILLQPLYFISAIMFPLSIIPPEYRHWVLWNPLVHAFELLRHTVFPAYPAEDVSLGYLAISALISLCGGLLLYKGREPAILRT